MASTPSLWRLPRVIAETGRGRTTIYDAVRAGSFPRPIPLGGRSVAWASFEIEQWIAQRIRERDAKPAGRLDGQTGAGGAP